MLVCYHEVYLLSMIGVNPLIFSVLRLLTSESPTTSLLADESSTSNVKRSDSVTKPLAIICAKVHQHKAAWV